MSKCLCYKCDFAVIRKYKRKSRIDNQIFLAFKFTVIGQIQILLMTNSQARNSFLLNLFLK